MALYIYKVFVFSALLVLLSTIEVIYAGNDADDGITVETEEDNQYQSPEVSTNNVYLAEHFDDINAFKRKWVKSEAKKQGVDENIAKYDGKWEVRAPAKKLFKDDLGLVLTTEAKHAAISALLDRPFEFKDKPLIVQYEVTMQEGQNCGGAYIKLLSRGTNTKADLRNFHDQTPYTIMFGPDKCGNDNKLHFIFRHKNPKNGTIEEKHSKKPTQRLEDIYKDKAPHLYTLIVRPDNTFSVLVDNKEVNAGSLLQDFTPPVNPPAEIDDPEDKKPDDWDEREKIVDPNATKPDDWDEDAPEQIVDPNAVKPDGWLEDEPEMISDPDAKKPDDWDEDMDGEWEAPLIDNPACASVGCGPWKPPMLPNPAYKGIWRAPLIPNPNYRGKWSPRRISNPHFFKDDQPFKMTPIHAVGFELWSMSPQLLFDNVVVADDEAAARRWAQLTFDLKQAKLAQYSQSLWGRFSRALNDRVGWWAAYAVYCAVPIAAYVSYLLKRANEDSVVDRYLKMAEDNPMLYYLVGGVAVVIFISIIYCCCRKSNDDPEGEKKKSEAVTEDDPHSDAEGAGEGEGDGDVEGDGEGEGEEQGESEGETERVTKADLEPTEKDAPPIDADAAGDGQRRRKPRKE